MWYWVLVRGAWCRDLEGFPSTVFMRLAAVPIITVDIPMAIIQVRGLMWLRCDGESLLSLLTYGGHVGGLGADPDAERAVPELHAVRAHRHPGGAGRPLKHQSGQQEGRWSVVARHVAHGTACVRR